MVPGPTSLRECPHCDSLIPERSIMSGNTFGAVYWTDGKMDAPMLPDEPVLVKCGGCSAVVWLEDLPVVREIPFCESTGADWAGVTDSTAPTFEECATYLASAAPDRERTRDIRTIMWWMRNDSRRNSQKATALSAAEATNVRELLALLPKDNPSSLLMTAEIHRELGEFDAALAVLSQVNEPELQTATRRLRALAKGGDPHVRTLLSPGDGG